jgi:glycosyltransferase involved in cell wall biosynthesis
VALGQRHLVDGAAMRRVGLVAYWYPPRQAAGALRAAALARYLPAFGWEPVVVTVRPRGSLYLPADGVLSGPQEVPAPDLATPDRAWHAIAAGAVEAVRGPAALETLKTENVLASRRPLARAAHWAYRQVLAFPDDTWPWLVDRGSVARLLAARGVSAIVSTSPPPTAHLVAAAAASRLGVPWIADYRDPWSQRSAWRRAWPLAPLEARLERRTLSGAAHVVAVSAPLADGLRRLLASPHVTVVPNGFDPADRDLPVRDPVPIPGDRFTLVHTGTLTHGSRDPGLVFEALDGLVARGALAADRLELWFIGRHLEVARRAASRWPRLAAAVRYAPQVSRAAALDAQRRATVLLALGSPDAAYDADVPTKAFEYLDAGRPVLGVASHGSALAALLAETRGGRVVTSAAEAACVLADWLAMWRRDGVVEAGGDAAAIARYERRRLTGAFARVLDRTVDAARAPVPQAQ